MLSIFKKEEGPVDVKTLRHEIVQFIKTNLQKWEGGEGANIKGLQLFLAPSAEEKHLYEAAVYVDDEARFKEEEVQRIADDYAIELPAAWTLELLFADTLPDEAIKAKDLLVALHVSTKKQPVLTTQTTAFITIMIGEAEKDTYTLSANGGKVASAAKSGCKRRKVFYGRTPLLLAALRRIKPTSLSVAKHAHIEWNSEAGAFFLYADEGGVPPRNKIKVQSVNGSVERLQSTQVGHLLQEGDQIVLGETALMKFGYGE